MAKLPILLGALAFSLGTIVANAQATRSATTNSQPVQTNKSSKSNTYKTGKAKDNNASSPEAVPAGPKKKDGSMDMRYKANKGKNKTTLKNSKS